jgi:hypothetical protein
MQAPPSYIAATVIVSLAFASSVLSLAFIGTYRQDKQKRDWSRNASYATAYVTMFLALLSALYMALLPSMLPSMLKPSSCTA